MKLQVPLNLNLLKKLLTWADSKYDYVAFFTDSGIPYPHSGFHKQLFAGNKKISIKDFHFTEIAPVGILSYDYKNQIENLQSTNPAIINHPDELFFIPEIKVSLSEKLLTIDHPLAEEYLNEIKSIPVATNHLKRKEIVALTSKESYIENVNNIRNHIIEGDVYEMNYCIAFQADIEEVSALDLFLRLNQTSPMPFSVYFKAKDQAVICASPERFLKKRAKSIIAQPIKGTIRRGSTHTEDQKLKSILLQSEKERSENLMIVDLMRNDLSKISLTGSVKVEELFGIYSFQQVHQMISTVSATPEDNCPFVKTINCTFPMGSMTGAPKIKCMELIDQYENFKRGWFSGTIGYIDDKGDFDFNVIIRSIFIDFNTKKLMFAVGSAITYDAVAEQEYDECLLKAKSIFEVLTE